MRTDTWNNSGVPGIDWGAQTSHAISPDLGFLSPTPELDPSDPEYMPASIDRGARTPYLWAAVSRLIDEVAELRGQLTAAEARITALEAD